MLQPEPTLLSPREFCRALTVPVQQAMAAVRWLDGRVSNRPKLDESSLEKAALTDADCVSQEILLVALAARFPDLALAVEEDTPSAVAFAGNRSPQCVVIDPIDGTLRYLRGDGHYAIIVGLERAGLVEAALVAVPRAGLLLRSVRGEGVEVSRAGAPFEPVQLSADGAHVLVSYGLPDRVRGRLRAAGLKPVIAAGGAIGVAPFLPEMRGGLRIIRDPAGLSPRAWVAASPTLEAGGCVERLEGGPLPEVYRPGVEGMLVGATQADVERLREFLE
jgi:fructose-1,6-bisphosphatase/inositol monophosphatase family enzyme